MPQGLQVWDASALLVQDVTDSLTRVLGYVDTGGNAGSLTDDRFYSGRPFYVLVSTTSGIARVPLRVSFSGNVMNWFQAEGFVNAPESRIYYGVY